MIYDILYMIYDICMHIHICIYDICIHIHIHMRVYIYIYIIYIYNAKIQNTHTRLNT